MNFPEFVYKIELYTTHKKSPKIDNNAQFSAFLKKAAIFYLSKYLEVK